MVGRGRGRGRGRTGTTQLFDVCLCSETGETLRAAPALHEGLYPAPPESVDEVTVTVPGVGSVVVPVTRS